MCVTINKVFNRLPITASPDMLGFVLLLVLAEFHFNSVKFKKKTLWKCLKVRNFNFAFQHIQKKVTDVTSIHAPLKNDYAIVLAPFHL